jgi:hypothetical protein
MSTGWSKITKMFWIGFRAFIDLKKKIYSSLLHFFYSPFDRSDCLKCEPIARVSWSELIMNLLDIILKTKLYWSTEYNRVQSILFLVNKNFFTRFIPRRIRTQHHKMF